MWYGMLLIFILIFSINHFFLWLSNTIITNVKDWWNDTYFYNIKDIDNNIKPCSKTDFSWNTYSWWCIKTWDLFIPNDTWLSINLTWTRIGSGLIYNWKLWNLWCAVYQWWLGKVNINTASSWDLETIIHIDSNNVNDIINNRVYTDINQLSWVWGLTWWEVDDIVNEGKVYLVEIKNQCN